MSILTPNAAPLKTLHPQIATITPNMFVPGHFEDDVEDGVVQGVNFDVLAFRQAEDEHSDE